VLRGERKLGGEQMKLISWNVNGLRACLTKGFEDFFYSQDADIFCIQETKMQRGQADFIPVGYYEYYSSAEKKGYSGTAVFSKIKPCGVAYGLGIDRHDHEGRLITLEFEDFFLLNVYTPNSQRELLRLSYRMEWEDAFREYAAGLARKKGVVICGDLNVAHKEIDLKNPKTNVDNAGFTPEERRKFSELLDAGFTDSFRYLYPEKEGAYTWWSYMFNARANNAGWRIDYFLVSNDIRCKIKDSLIYSEVKGSDHCPVGLILMPE
jgi:exodeoxyribonuclease-3